MCGQTVLADIGPVDQAAFNHIPPQNPLQAPKDEENDKLRCQLSADPSPDPEHHHRHQKRDADQAAQKPMRKFKPEYRLKFGQAHTLIDLQVFRGIPVIGEHRLPFRQAQRRQPSRYRVPIDHGQSRLGKPGHASENNHEKNHRRDNE